LIEKKHIKLEEIRFKRKSLYKY